MMITYGWASTWFTAGGIRALARSFRSLRMLKLDTPVKYQYALSDLDEVCQKASVCLPISLALPLSTTVSMAVHVEQ